MLDPKDELGNISDLFIEAFSGGRIGLLDVPSGAGAASADILVTVARLREAGIIPRQPLHVLLLAGDISNCARSYASEMIAGLRSYLEYQGIFVETRFEYWDVLDANETAAILFKWVTWAQNCRRYFVIMANFSGFLNQEKKFNKATQQLEQMFIWAEQRNSTVIWIEPQTNEARIGLFPRLFKLFKKKLPPRFRAMFNESDALRLTECRYKHPIQSHLSPNVRLCVIRLESTDS